MKFFVVLILFLSSFEILAATNALTSAFMGTSVMDFVDRRVKEKNKGWFWSIFSDNDFSLENIMVVTEADMNNGGAMRAHLVIVYSKEMLQILGTMTARQYFCMIDQLIKDHPDTMKIYSWTLIAENRIRGWQPIDTLKESMNPLGGFIFADYDNGTAVHRARVPDYEKVKVNFGRNDFKIEYEDQSLYEKDLLDVTETRADDYYSKPLENPELFGMPANGSFGRTRLPLNISNNQALPQVNSNPFDGPQR